VSPGLPPSVRNLSDLRSFWPVLTCVCNHRTQGWNSPEVLVPPASPFDRPFFAIAARYSRGVAFEALIKRLDGGGELAPKAAASTS
jgi:hypothetical protein